MPVQTRIKTSPEPGKEEVTVLVKAWIPGSGPKPSNEEVVDTTVTATWDTSVFQYIDGTVTDGGDVREIEGTVTWILHIIVGREPQIVSLQLTSDSDRRTTVLTSRVSAGRMHGEDGDEEIHALE